MYLSSACNINNICDILLLELKGFLQSISFQIPIKYKKNEVTIPAKNLQKERVCRKGIFAGCRLGSDFTI